MNIRISDTENDIVWNSKPDCLYNHEFENGRFFQTVHEEHDSATFRIAAKTMLKVVFLTDKNDLEGLEIIKVIDGIEKQKIKLSKFNLAQIKAFLHLLCQLDLGDISERKISITNKEGFSVDSGFIEKFKNILQDNDCMSCLENWLDEGVFTEKDLVNTGYRKAQLTEFRKMLDDPSYRLGMADKLGVNKNQEEKIWQAFFKKNSWIFGYGLDYHYREILQREYQAGAAEGDGKEAVITDYMIADSRFCAFVELKTPETKLFRRTQTHRAKTWGLSTDLMDAVSQILQQKASSELRIESQRNHVINNNGNRSYLKQHAYDPKVFLIIGSWSEVDDINEPDIDTKQRTFELYRRNLRNVDILTYDELYERAKFIVEGSECLPDKDDMAMQFNVDNLPF